MLRGRVGGFAAGVGHDPRMNTETAVSARPTATLMWLTYLVGGIGYFIGISTVQQEPASLSVAALLAVTATGVLSFIRESLKSDVCMRSDPGW
jgi:hypothetical protein